jgi:oxysterol-binding protein 1
VTTSIYNLILGKLYCDHYGTMRIQGNGEYSCKLKFKEQSIIDRNPHQVISTFADLFQYFVGMSVLPSFYLKCVA